MVGAAVWVLPCGCCRVGAAVWVLPCVGVCCCCRGGAAVGAAAAVPKPCGCRAHALWLPCPCSLVEAGLRFLGLPRATCSQAPEADLPSAALARWPVRSP